MTMDDANAGGPRYTEPCVIPTIAVSGVASRIIVAGMLHMAFYVDKVTFDDGFPRQDKEICLRLAIPLSEYKSASAETAMLLRHHEDMAPAMALRC